MGGKAEIQSLVSQLRIQPASTITEGAHRLYGLALSKNFTRGRRTAQVRTGSLYVLLTFYSQSRLVLQVYSLWIFRRFIALRVVTSHCRHEPVRFACGHCHCTTFQS